MEVDKDLLQVALAKAISESVPPEMQKEIFAQALAKHLFNTGSNSKESVISSTFQQALNKATAELAHEIVNSPENVPRIRDIMQKAMIAFLDDPNTVRKITEKFVSGFSRW
jgi:UTP:GlnB (protein PII) uridylyltransferase